jgi:hypothetical protein
MADFYVIYFAEAGVTRPMPKSSTEGEASATDKDLALNLKRRERHYNEDSRTLPWKEKLVLSEFTNSLSHPAPNL